MKNNSNPMEEFLEVDNELTTIKEVETPLSDRLKVLEITEALIEVDKTFLDKYLLELEQKRLGKELNAYNEELE